MWVGPTRQREREERREKREREMHASGLGSWAGVAWLGGPPFFKFLSFSVLSLFPFDFGFGFLSKTNFL